MFGQTLRPRLCVLEKGENGYGFHLHGEKGKVGQFIRLVEPDSPSELSGLRAGDRLVFVNGERVETDNHQQVVARIRATAGNLELIVVDMDTDQLLNKYGLKCVKEFVTEGVPVPEYDEPEIDEEMMGNGEPRDSPTPPPIPERNVEIIPVHNIPAEVKLRSSVSSETDLKLQLRPRLCVIWKGPNGFGFNLHSEKSRPGQYIRAIDDDSPAEKSGLKAKDRIIQVNGVPVQDTQHSQVVAIIRSGGDETSLVVVDPDTDAYFKKCGVTPTAEHITGALPEPLLNGNMDDKINGNVAKHVELKDSKSSVSPSPSNASSNASLTTPPTETPPPETVEGSMVAAIPELNLSLQQVKERARQKRSSKRAPPMDWSKKNELFSNL
ncbi:Na(+)/H(+) exchange regulatory cofactor NHE-RF1 [Triplophysa dalaica]|uniref:Na(+)/H(+) exchange regulatory cofactor NHE-RF1 n=1 Tax=Triplophysa dalaica TaxID=1582913 RepID=UPI0024DF7D8E|nr:Na(+)/H(+) exchange regulatory cofactor NHE-RF1 [Triplophysa dalaica]